MPANRGCEGLTYLADKYSEYCKIRESSNLPKRKMKDALTPMDYELIDKTPSMTSSSDNSV